MHGLATPVPYEVYDLSRVQWRSETPRSLACRAVSVELEESGIELGQVSGRIVALTLHNRIRIEFFGPLCPGPWRSSSSSCRGFLGGSVAGWLSHDFRGS